MGIPHPLNLLPDFLGFLLRAPQNLRFVEVQHFPLNHPNFAGHEDIQSPKALGDVGKKEMGKEVFCARGVGGR